MRVSYAEPSYGREEIKAVTEAVKNKWLTAGKKAEEFEKEVCKIFGKKHGVMVNSGSSANLLALEALDLPKGSKVLTPALTFATTIAPIIQLGFEPVLVDVNEDFTINLKEMERRKRAQELPSSLI